MLIFGLNSASVLAQVNFGTNSASILGIFLAIAGAGLYFLRTVRPELSRDQDIFFAAVGLLCGFILIFQGWRLDPILQFGQLLLVGTTVYFAVESIRLRGIATQQAKRNTPIEDEREVSSRYSYSRRTPYSADVEEAELDPLPYDPYYEDERPRPQIPGGRDARSARSGYYEDETPRRSERGNGGYRNPRGDMRRRSSSRPPSRAVDRLEQDDWESTPKLADEWDRSAEEPRRPSRRGSSRPTRPDTDEPVARPIRKRRPPKDTTPTEVKEQAGQADYVEYKPIDRSSSDEIDDVPNYDDL